jgi:hypothetical protein
VRNNGTESFTVTSAEVFVNEFAPVSILDSFPTPAVVTGGNVIFGTAEETINVCGNENFEVTFTVTASTAIGGVCTDTDEFQFIPPPVG